MAFLGLLKGAKMLIDPVKHIQGVVVDITESEENPDMHQLIIRKSGLRKKEPYPVPLYPENYKIIQNPPNSETFQSVVIGMKKKQDWKIKEKDTAYSWLVGHDTLQAELRAKEEELELKELELHKKQQDYDRLLNEKIELTPKGKEETVECKHCGYELTKEDLRLTKGFCLNCNKVPSDTGSD